MSRLKVSIFFLFISDLGSIFSIWLRCKSDCRRYTHSMLVLYDVLHIHHKPSTTGTTKRGRAYFDRYILFFFFFSFLSAVVTGKVCRCFSFSVSPFFFLWDCVSLRLFVRCCLIYWCGTIEGYHIGSPSIKYWIFLFML